MKVIKNGFQIDYQIINKNLRIAKHLINDYLVTLIIVDDWKSLASISLQLNEILMCTR